MGRCAQATLDDAGRKEPLAGPGGPEGGFIRIQHDFGHQQPRSLSAPRHVNQRPKSAGLDDDVDEFYEAIEERLPDSVRRRS